MPRLTEIPLVRISDHSFGIDGSQAAEGFLENNTSRFGPCAIEGITRHKGICRYESRKRSQLLPVGGREISAIVRVRLPTRRLRENFGSTATSICSRIATICSGLCFFRAIIQAPLIPDFLSFHLI